MSAKWRRSKAWDDQFFPRWAWPAKFALRALSSIPLAVVTLTLVCIYCILASVPIGMLALIPSYLLYGATLLATIALVTALGLLALHPPLRRAPRPLRLGIEIVAGIALIALGSYLWATLDTPATWPGLRYDPAHDTGVRFFADFAQRYEATTLRRLPGIEKTEVEFYGWWPLRILLVLFVVNMMVATIRRIEFNFKNIGVLTVHTGIIVITLGSLYYATLKKEGDLRLIAGTLDERGFPTRGPSATAFYDLIDTALYVSQLRGWEQRRLKGLPRYNEYNLGAALATTASDVANIPQPWQGIEDRTLALRVPAPPPSVARVDPDITFRVVGYAPYAEAHRDYKKIDPASVPARAGAALNPLRIVQLKSNLSAGADAPVDPDALRAAFSFILLPRDPAHRVAENEALGVEYAIAMPDRRLEALRAPVPAESEHALSIRIPDAGINEIVPITQGITIERAGYRIRVNELLPEPPFPIITEGYRGATSSVAVVRVTTPAGQTFERYLYHRFPEIAQDMLEGVTDDGRPQRRDPDTSIDLYYLDDTRLQVYFNEPIPGAPPEAIVRLPGQPPRVETLDADAPRLRDLLREARAAQGRDDQARLDLAVTERWAHAQPFNRPDPVPEADRERDFVGNHRKAMMAVEVSTPAAGAPDHTTLLWLPFTSFPVEDTGSQRSLTLPDGRVLKLAFGPVRHPLLAFSVALDDFQMLAYDHRGAPRDYQSLLHVTPVEQTGLDPYTHVTKLNAPLRAPFHWDPEGPWLVNVGRRLLAGFDPNQYKLSQAGWDADHWRDTQAQADAGEIARPWARFTDLRVGNNPGIHVIALGSILIAIGTPWAFYIKPWLVRREKTRLAAQARAVGRPTTPRASAHHPEPEHAGAAP